MWVSGGRKGRGWPCGLKYPCLFVQSWVSLRSGCFLLPGSVCGVRKRILSVALRGYVCVQMCICVCLFVGLCLYWLSSLLVTLRPGAARGPPCSPTLSETFPLPASACWVLGGAKVQRSLVEMGPGMPHSTMVSMPALRFRERVATGQSFARGNGKPWPLSSTPCNLWPGSSPAVFVNLYACWETAGCQVAGPGCGHLR